MGASITSEGHFLGVKAIYFPCRFLGMKNPFSCVVTRISNEGTSVSIICSKIDNDPILLENNVEELLIAQDKIDNKLDEHIELLNVSDKVIQIDNHIPPNDQNNLDSSQETTNTNDDNEKVVEFSCYLCNMKVTNLLFKTIEDNIVILMRLQSYTKLTLSHRKLNMIVEI